MIPIFPREGMVEQPQATRGLPLSSRLVNPDVNTPHILFVVAKSRWDRKAWVGACGNGRLPPT